MAIGGEEFVAHEADGVSLSSRVMRIGKLSTIYTLGSIAPQVIAMLLLPVFTAYLVPAQLGIVTLAGRVTAPLGVLVQLGLWSGLKMQYFRTEPALRPRLVRTILIGQALQGIAVCAVLSVAGVWLAEVLLPNLPLSQPLVFALWLMVVWTCLLGGVTQLAVGMSQLLERAYVSVGINCFNYLLQAGLGVAAVVGLGWEGFGRQGTIFAASAVAAIVSFQVIWGYGKGGFDRALFKPAFFRGLSFVPHQFAALLALATNSWLLNKMDSTAALAVYGIAVGFVSLIDLPLFAFNNASYPTLAKLMSVGSPSAMGHQSRLYTLQILTVVSLTLAVSLFSPIAITILTASEYHGATQIVAILVLGWLFQGLYLVVGQPVFFFGGGLWLAAATVTATTLSVALGLWLIPLFGIYGAAWAMVTHMLVAFLVAAAASYHLYRLPWEVTKIVRALACGVLLAAADVWLSPGLSLIWAILLKVLLMIAFAPALWLAGVTSTAELRRTKDIVLARFRLWLGR